MKKLFAVTLCLALLTLCACGDGKDKSSVPSGEWDVSIENIDPGKPENKEYIDWAKEKGRDFWSATFSEPEYFDVDSYATQANKDAAAWIDVWEDEANGKRRERYCSWNDTKDLVICFEHIDEESSNKELLIRDKATGKTETVAKGSNRGVFDVYILSGTRFLYRQDKDWNYGPFWWYIYDMELGGEICVASSDGGDLCDLGDERYLWSDWNNIGDVENALYLIDMRAFAAGSKDAKRELFRWGGDYFGLFLHLSSDKRFVYMNIYASFTEFYRGVYNVDTGEQVAFFEIQADRIDSFNGYALINDELEYLYEATDNYNDPDIKFFYVIRYDRAVGKP
ncbi:MAG: hypothetical protein FWF05_02315 [Oscillospiraceae bacterium]|nr:hypothetical protein [Oscillospiraceae bacterium]